MKHEVFQIFEAIWGRVRQTFCLILTGADTPVAPAIAAPLNNVLFLWQQKVQTLNWG